MLIVILSGFVPFITRQWIFAIGRCCMGMFAVVVTYYKREALVYALPFSSVFKIRC